MSQEVVTPSNVMDIAAALNNMDGDAELLREIVEIFLDTADDQIAGLRSAIAAGDVKTVAIDSHGMKGGASNFCAGAFVQAALELELLAKGGTLEGADALLDRMVEHLEELREVESYINWDEVAAGRIA